MNYVEAKTQRNFLTAAVLLIVATCLKMTGMFSMLTTSLTTLQWAYTSNYVWTQVEEALITIAFRGQIQWYSITIWTVFVWTCAAGGLILLLRRFLSLRLAAFAALPLLALSLNGDGALYLAGHFVDAATQPGKYEAMLSDMVSGVQSKDPNAMDVGLIPRDIPAFLPAFFDSSFWPIMLLGRLFQVFYYGFMAVIFSTVAITFVGLTMSAVGLSSLGLLKRRAKN